MARGVAPDELFLGGEDCAFRAESPHGKVNQASMPLATRGSDMIFNFTRGKGEVFRAGSVEWTAGLLRREPQVERITSNVSKKNLKG